MHTTQYYYTLHSAHYKQKYKLKKVTHTVNMTQYKLQKLHKLNMLTVIEIPLYKLFFSKEL